MVTNLDPAKERRKNTGRMPAKPANLSISELKAKLKVVAEQTRESMAEMLYSLREKLKAQGIRNDLQPC